MDQSKVKERRRQKAIERSRLAAPKPKKQRTEEDLLRLERYKQRQILFRRFEI